MWEIRWLRRLQYHRNASGCQKLRSTAHPAIALRDSWAPPWHKFFSSPFLQSVSNERFPGSYSLHQQSFWLLISDQIEQFLLPVLCCHLSVLTIVIRCAARLQQVFCLQKIFCASERLALLTLHHLQRPAEVLRMLWWQCHRVQSKKKKNGIPLRDVPGFHFHDEVHKHLLTCQAPTPHWGIAQSCHCKWGWRKDQGQRLSVLADCSIACTTRRKLISLLYCQTSYIHLNQGGF